MNLTGKMSNTNDDNTDKIIRLMQTDRSVDAPADAVKWSKDIFRTRAAEPKRSAVEKVLAVLQMDLSPDKAAFGERSGSVSASRQMFFEAGENGIDLRISPVGEGFDIQGQVLGGGFENCTVRLGDLETPASELSEFRLTSVPKGTYDLSLQTGTREIIIEKIEIN